MFSEIELKIDYHKKSNTTSSNPVIQRLEKSLSQTEICGNLF